MRQATLLSFRALRNGWQSLAGVKDVFDASFQGTWRITLLEEWDGLGWYIVAASDD